MIVAARRHGGLSNTWRAGLWATLVVLLALPAIAMPFTAEVAWDATDFAAAALLLTGVGIAVELAFRLSPRPGVRLAAVGVALVAVVLIWADAAVGVF